MKRSIFPAVFAALVVSILVNVISLSLRDDGRGDLLRRAEDAEKRVLGSADKVDTVVRRLEALERRSAGSRRGIDVEGGEAASPEVVVPDGAAVFPVDENGAPLAPDGTPFISRKDLEAEVAKAIAARSAAFQGLGAPVEPAKTLEEVAAEMGLSAGEEAQLRIIQRESEDEVLDIFFPGQRIEEIKQTAKELKDDPDRLSAFVQQGLMRAFSNAGKLMTLDRRRNKSIKDALGEERAAEFRSKRVKPFYGEDLEHLMDGLLRD